MSRCLEGLRGMFDRDLVMKTVENQKEDPPKHTASEEKEGSEKRNESSKQHFNKIPTCSQIRIETQNVSYDVQLDDAQGRCRKALVSTFHSLKQKLSPGKAPHSPPTLPFKRVLNDVSISIGSGILTALMGTSGAGKSTLLNILSGRARCTQGCVMYNGEVITKSICQKASSYVEQEDLFIPDITADEHLQCQLKLRLSRGTHKDDAKKSADILFHDLELLKCRYTKITDSGNELGGLSGGEKKRLNIASELCRFPAILFADEPTTGLDYHTAKSVVRQLRYLADSGRTVVTSIHQPSSEIFEMFDHVVLLSEGRILYHGDRVGCIIWFEKLGHPCPALYNPADFIIAKTSVPNHPAQRQEKMLQLNKWADKWDKEGANFLISNETFQFLQKVKTFQKLQCQYISKTREESPMMGSMIVSGSSKDVNVSKSFVEGDTTPAPLKALNENKKENIYSNLSTDIEWNRPTWFEQMVILHRRALLRTRRNRTQLFSRALQSIVLSLVFGFLFFRLEWNLHDATARIGATYMILINQSMSGAFTVVNTFFSEKPVIRREYSTGLIDFSAYFVAKMLADFIPQLFFTFFFILITFWIIGLGSGVGTFFRFLIIGIFLSNSATSLGYLSSAVGSTPEVAALICNLITFPLSMFGGFLVSINDTKSFLSWIQHISFVKHGFFEMRIQEDRQVCCVDGSPMDGLQFISQRLGVPNISFIATFFIIFAVFVVYRLIAVIGACLAMQWTCSTEQNI